MIDIGPKFYLAPSPPLDPIGQGHGNFMIKFYVKDFKNS